jgi:hypothetical protein
MREDTATTAGTYNKVTTAGTYNKVKGGNNGWREY